MNLKEIRERLEPVVISESYELHDIEWVEEGKRFFLRVFIDSEKGVELEDCAKISRKASLILDAEESISVPYTLEVSSPGIFRKLNTDKDFTRFIGERVKLIQEFEKIKKTVGILSGYTSETITILVENEPVQFLRSEIKKISLAPKI